MDTDERLYCFLRKLVLFVVGFHSLLRVIQLFTLISNRHFLSCSVNYHEQFLLYLNVDQLLSPPPTRDGAPSPDSRNLIEPPPDLPRARPVGRGDWSRRERIEPRWTLCTTKPWCLRSLCPRSTTKFDGNRRPSRP